MSKSSADPQARAEWLRQTLQAADHAYYGAGDSELDDAEYDALMRDLRDIEEAHPEIAAPTSPTRRVGAPLSGTFAKARHGTPMLSLENAFSAEDLATWTERVRRAAGGDISFLVEPKLDGLSLSLRYRHGVLVQALTRGDGAVGDDVSANARHVAGVPEHLDLSGWPDEYEIRGEALLPRPAFHALNAAREANGDPLFATPRNAATGSLRQKDARITAGRGLVFIAFTAAAPNARIPVPTQQAIVETLGRAGLRVPEPTALCPDAAAIERHAQTLAERRATLDVELDGAVVKVNDLALQRRMGASDRAPKWAVARKWPAEEAATRLLDIEIQVGRSGALSPVAILEPVRVAGVEVQRATLHNEEHIRSLDLRIGDRVRIVRSGEVIPRILGVLRSERTGEETPWSFPDTCPSCGSEVRRLSTRGEHQSAATYCVNPACPPQRLRGLEHFASRDAMDIRGLGPRAIAALVAAELVKAPADLYDLRAEQVAVLPGYGRKRADALVRSVAASTSRPFARVLYALGCPHLGRVTAEAVARGVQSMVALSAASAADLQRLDGVGQAVAETIVTFLATDHVRTGTARLAAAGLAMQVDPDTQPTRGGGALEGKTFVLTGTLSSPRPVVAERIAALGARVSTSVSGRTDYLVAGDNAGSKRARAKKLGVAILSEAGLEALVAEVRSEPVSHRT